MDGTIEYPLVKPDEMAAEAWAAMGRGDADEALRLWRQLRQQFPERADAHVWPIQVLWQDGRVDEAEQVAAAAFARFPDNPDLLGQYAWIAMSRQRWDEALQWWAKARSRAPDRAEGYVWAARALWQLGRLDEAEAMAIQAVDRFPDDTAALTEQAWVAVTRGDWGEALRRWMLVNRADPDRLDATVGIVQALRMVGRIDEAESKGREALSRFPDDADLLIQHLWTAVARGDWDAAAVRMEAARDKLNDPKIFQERIGWVEQQLKQRAGSDGDAATTPAKPSAARKRGAETPKADIPPGELMLAFESLGERCDFGAVQRKFGVEPLGLLRFAFASYDPLIAALEDRFDAVGTLEDTSFERYNDECILYMRKYRLIFHTFVNYSEMNTGQKLEAFRQQQRRRLTFLKDKLISDLEDPQKIFVYSTNERTTDADAKRLFRLLRSYGPNSLLYVRPARRNRPEGSVEVLQPGLVAGYFPGLIDFVAGQQPPFDLWRGMCERTYQLARPASP